MLTLGIVIPCEAILMALMPSFVFDIRALLECGTDELHMIFECPALQAVRQRYASLFSANTDFMRSFFAQQDHMQDFKFVLDCHDVFQI